MSKHTKFELEELPKSAVVNSNVHSQDQEAMQLINEVVTEHISKIVDDVHIEEAEDEIKKKINEPVVIANTEPVIDIEQVKQESYSKGLEEASAKYELMLAELKLDYQVFPKMCNFISIMS